MRYCYSILLGIYFFVAFQTAYSQSLLSKGNIIQLDVAEEGIYKIDYSWLQQNGFNPSNINPSQIAIYGLEGGMLSQSNEIDRLEGIQSLPIWVKGESDGSFDTDDAIYFYAQASGKVFQDSVRDFFQFDYHLYDDLNHYYLCIDSEFPQRVTSTNVDVANATNTTEAWSVIHYEEELKNFFTSGRYWVGEEFSDTTPFNFPLSLDNFSNISEVKTKVSVVATARENSSFTVYLNGTPLGEVTVKGAPDYNIKKYTRQGNWGEEYFTHQKENWEPLSEWYVSMVYNINATDDRGYLNAFTLNLKNSIKPFTAGNNYFLQDPGKYALKLNADKVWDVSDFYNIKNLNIENGTAVLETNLSPKFIVFNELDAINPVAGKKVTNQDLISLAPSNLLIISHSDYLNEAKRLADFRSTNDGLSTTVVDVEEVYHEFSSGKQDITALRDFIKHLYKKDPSTFKYVLLFGSTSYDYKGNEHDRARSQVPIYESREILFETKSFSSDDYIGFMDEGEGSWAEELDGSVDLDTLDLGIGRLPVKNLEEATGMVDKLIAYEENKGETVGNWKQLITLIADDGDNNTHQRQSDQLGSYLEENAPLFNPNRIFLDDYTLEGNTYPDVNTAIDACVEEGTMIMNYSGHGGIGIWADEGILSVQQIKSWKNEFWPLMVTATCEFGRYDYPPLISGAEVALLSPTTGAIALLTTTRPVYSSSNFSLNKAFYDEIFSLDEEGLFPRLGDVIKNTKNKSISGVSNRNFALLGDPSMRLIYPKNKAQVIQLNGNDLQLIDTLKALQKINIAGEILHYSGGRDDTYNGVVDVTVFGKKTSQYTKGNRGEETVFQYEAAKNILFRGSATVANGEFTIDFVVPKDITYDFGEGKMSLYTYSNAADDGAGYWNEFLIGGTEENITLDTNEPEVELWLENKDFVNGQVIQANTVLLADIYDESGINMTGLGIGHDIVAWIDDREDEAWVLNDYYQAVQDDYTRGNVAFPINDLEVGKHTLSMRVWDTHNNARIETINFVVNEVNDIGIQNLVLWPNPVNDHFNIAFQHNLPDEDLIVTMKILSYDGGVLDKQSYTILKAPQTVDNLKWVNDTYRYWPNQLYLVIIEVYAPELGIKNQKATKLVFD